MIFKVLFVVLLSSCLQKNNIFARCFNKMPAAEENSEGRDIMGEGCHLFRLFGFILLCDLHAHLFS